MDEKQCKEYAFVKAVQGAVLGIAIGASIALAATVPLLEAAAIRVEASK